MIMEHLVFSLNSVLPVFMVMGIGFYLGRRNLLTGDFVGQATSLVFYTALPAKLFLDVSRSNFSDCLEGRQDLPGGRPFRRGVLLADFGPGADGSAAGGTA